MADSAIRAAVRQSELAGPPGPQLSDNATYRFLGARMPLRSQIPDDRLARVGGVCRGPHRVVGRMLERSIWGAGRRKEVSGRRWIQITLVRCYCRTRITILSYCDRDGVTSEKSLLRNLEVDLLVAVQSGGGKQGRLGSADSDRNTGKAPGQRCPVGLHRARDIQTRAENCTDRTLSGYPNPKARCGCHNDVLWRLSQRGGGYRKTTQH